jgi:hypothetical protein
LSKNPKDCLDGISDKTMQDVILFYLKPNSKKNTAMQFGMTLHTVICIFKKMNVSRDARERGKLISASLKKTLKENPEIVEARVKYHTGSKRTTESRKKMQIAAWKRMERQVNCFVSKAETEFGNFLKTKLGLDVVPQYRAGLKPFDFLVDNRALVEFDGPHHYDPEYYMCKSGKVDYNKQQERDEKRKEIAASLNLPLIIVKQKDTDKKNRLCGDLMHEFMYKLGYECA